jgi:hypothetical protein
MSQPIHTLLLAGRLAPVIATATAASTGRTAGVPTHAATVTARITLPRAPATGQA